MKEDSKEQDKNPVRSGKFWALVAASFVVLKALPKRRRTASVASNIVPRAMNQMGSVSNLESKKV